MENWVKHIPPDELINLEPKATNKDTFDIYIDCVRFIPDSASIIKVFSALKLFKLTFFIIIKKSQITNLKFFHNLNEIKI